MNYIDLNDTWCIGSKCGLLKKSRKGNLYHVKLNKLKPDVRETVERLITLNTDLSSKCKEKFINPIRGNHLQSTIQIPPKTNKLNDIWYLTDKCSLKKMNKKGSLRTVHYDSLKSNVKDELKELLTGTNNEDISKLCKLRFGVDLDKTEIELLKRETENYQEQIDIYESELVSLEDYNDRLRTKLNNCENDLKSGYDTIQSLKHDNNELKTNLKESDNVKKKFYYSHLPYNIPHLNDMTYMWHLQLHTNDIKTVILNEFESKKNRRIIITEEQRCQSTKNQIRFRNMRNVNPFDINPSNVNIDEKVILKIIKYESCKHIRNITKTFYDGISNLKLLEKLDVSVKVYNASIFQDYHNSKYSFYGVICMEDGGKNLRQFLRENKNDIAKKTITDIGKQIERNILRLIDKQHVYWMDIKYENICIKEGIVKFIDCGDFLKFVSDHNNIVRLTIDEQLKKTNLYAEAILILKDKRLYDQFIKDILFIIMCIQLIFSNIIRSSHYEKELVNYFRGRTSRRFNIDKDNKQIIVGKFLIGILKIVMMSDSDDNFFNQIIHYMRDGRRILKKSKRNISNIVRLIKDSSANFNVDDMEWNGEGEEKTSISEKKRIERERGRREKERRERKRREREYIEKQRQRNSTPSSIPSTLSSIPSSPPPPATPSSMPSSTSSTLSTLSSIPPSPPSTSSSTPSPLVTPSLPPSSPLNNECNIKGLDYVENSCYIDTVMLCIFAIKHTVIDKHILEKDINTLKNTQNCRREDKLNIQNVLKKIANSIRGTGDVKVCTELRNCLRHCPGVDAYHLTDTQDAGDFLAYLFTIFECEIAKETTETYGRDNSTTTSWEKSETNDINSLPIKYIYNIKCGLNITKTVLYEEIEEVTDWKFNQKKTIGKFNSPYIIFNVRRQTQNDFTNYDRIYAPETFILNNVQLTLSAIVVYTGRAHYIANFKCKGEWYLYNDNPKDKTHFIKKIGSYNTLINMKEHNPMTNGTLFFYF